MFAIPMVIIIIVCHLTQSIGLCVYSFYLTFASKNKPFHHIHVFMFMFQIQTRTKNTYTSIRTHKIYNNIYLYMYIIYSKIVQM